MSIIRDLMDLRDGVSDSLEDGTVKVNARSSISKESSTGVLQFPLLTSSSLSLEQTTTISKALEREYSSFIVIMTSMDSVTSEKSVKNYINKIHQNIGGDNTDLSNFRESVSFGRVNGSDLELFQESENNTISLIENTDIESLKLSENEYIMNVNEMTKEELDCSMVILSEKIKKGAKFNKSNKLQSIVARDTSKDLEQHPVNECFSQIFFIKDDETEKIRLIESSLFTLDIFDKDDVNRSQKKVLKEAANSLSEYVPDFNMNILNKQTVQNNYVLIGNKYLTEKYNNFGEDIATQNILSEADIGKELTTNNNRINDDTASVPKDVLRDNDVRKANELAPTLLHLKTYFKDDDDALHAVDYMIGVKCVVHKVDSQSMIENMAKGAKRGKFFFNLMKLTTGEMTFWKDFVFAVSRIKDDIKTKYKDNPWWNTLIRRRKYSGVLKTLNIPTQLVPNTTVALSMDEVHKLSSEYGVNLMNVKTAKDIIEQYFLMGIVIVDATVETAYFLFDSTGNYAEYSFNALEKENSNSSRDIKNIMQVLGRM